MRVRFAPSPTGYLHIGGVRTALYNYLFARHHGGEFILRIEDTDLERSKEEYTEIILDGLKWLGLEWDEGPYFQSKRMPLYKEALDYLVEKERVYKCFCTPSELKERREQARREGSPTGYDGRCRRLTRNQAGEYEQAGREYVYRIKTPQSGRVAFKDLVKGPIEIDASILSDFVLFKSDGMPTYNFACVVDDADLKITHIIRGDDHIPNTHKQILLYKALDKEVPEFAHLPQVHGTDGKRLSKRTGAVSLDEYRRQGYLPEALRNYLVLLGWSTGDAQQLFEWEELIEKFELSRCGKSAGVFDLEKLNWMNGKYIRELSAGELAKRSFKWLKEE
ncbi:MAG: glutamate--tRNA ligase, partial [Elusimicrobiota bacterium]|nr:glutamate--tRNA ligase [Elusimicrobiota bacterium]